MKGKNTELRIRAAVVLGKLGADARPALPALFEAAKDSANVGAVLRAKAPSGVAAAAIESALKIDPDCAAELAKAALPELTKALESKDTAVVEAAGTAISRLGAHAKPALPALEEAQKRATGFAEYSIRSAVVAAGRDVTKPLAAVIRDAKAPLDKRLGAISSLRYGQAGKAPAVTLLLEALKDPEPRLAAAAVDALGSLGPDAKDAIPTLLERLDDEKLGAGAGENRGRALLPRVPHMLAQIGKDAVPGLVETLKDKEKKPLARYHAAFALAELGAKARAARPALEEALGDRYLAVALESARAYLRAGGDPAKAMPIVRAGLRHKAPFIIRRAAQAAEQMSGHGEGLVKDLTTLLDHNEREVRISAAHALSHMGPAAKPAVLAMATLLKSDDGRQRFQVATALEQLGPDAREAAAALVECLKDKEVGNISPDSVMRALGKLGPAGKDAVPRLIELLKMKRPFLEKDVLETLGSIGPDAKDAVLELVRRLDDKSVFTRAAAARALGGIGPAAKEAVPALTKMLGDEGKQGRAWAAYALARITGESKARVADLIELWEDDEPDEPFGSARYDVAQALQSVGPDAQPARDILLAAVTSAKTPAGTRLQAARALGHLREDAEMIVPKMIEVLGRPAKGLDRVSDCQAAAAALEGLGPKAKAAIPALRTVLDDEENGAVDAARQALEKIAKE